MAISFTDIQKVRMEVQDMEPGFYLLSDEEIQYFLDKNNSSIVRSSLDAAKSLLFKLSINSSDSTVDIFSVKGSKAAEMYREALKLYIKDQTLNPMLSNVSGYVGGVSISDMQANDYNLDNNIVVQPSNNLTGLPTGFFTVQVQV